ncbi:hypothetical protein ACWDO0_15340 [Nocardia rhamnosiphila]
MADPVDKSQLDSAVENLRTKIEEWRNIPDEINSTVDDLKYYAPVAWAFVTKKRDEAQDKIETLIKKLDEVLTGINAPFTFLGWAADWQVVGASVRAASNAQARPEVSVEGFWSGEAKDSFNAAKAAQDKAFTSAVEVCTKIETSMLNLSKSALDFYIKLADTLATYMANLTAALAEVGSVILAYEGAPGLVQAAADVLVLVEGLMTALLSTVQSQMVEANALDNATDNPWGFYGDRWPDAIAKTYNDPAYWQPTRA